MLAGYRKEAGLPANAVSYPNWDGLDGHVGGHDLSALAMNYAPQITPCASNAYQLYDCGIKSL